MNINHKDIQLSIENINSSLPALVNRIRRGYKKEIIFELYTGSEKKNLILSLNPGIVSLHIAYHPILYRSEADKIVLKLRRLFERRIIEKVVQYQNERIVNIFFANTPIFLRFIIFPKTPALGIYENDTLIFSEGNISFDIREEKPSGISQNYYSNYELSEEYYNKLCSLIIKEYKIEKTKKIESSLTKYYQTYKKIKEEISRTTNYKEWADILSSFHSNDTRKGITQIETTDFYGNKINIKLNPSYSVKDHIKIYYEKDKKDSKAKKINQRRLEYVEEKIKKLENEKEIIESADLKEILKQIKIDKDKEKTRNNFIKKFSKTRKLLTYHDKDGNYFIIGKNEEENQQILKIGKPNNLWFHARDYPGSHLLLITRDKKIDNNLINIAAKLSVFYSKCRKFKEGYVMYTFFKYLKRIKGTKQGQVNVTKYKSLFVRIDDIENIIENHLSKV